MANVCPTCGHETKSIRSLIQHRRYFGVIKAAFHHWPESHPTQFTSEDDLRHWLQMKAGHREVAARIPIVGMPKAKLAVIVEQVIRAIPKAYCVPVVHGTDLVILIPKSIAFSNLGHLKFCELNNAIDEVLKTEIGISGDELLAEHKQAA